jgi:hypothetical protein|tara:strand:- start:280 stop:549 length:270 start_codon:yes stop_codon:yes gene_type:complete
VPFFKGDIMKNTIEYIKELENKIKYLEELDKKNFLNILKLENKIRDYENKYIELDKYEEIYNDYVFLIQFYEKQTGEYFPALNKKEVIK